MKIIIIIYVILMPFMSALAPIEWLPLPLVLLILVMPILLMHRSGPKLSVLLRRDLGFVMMFVLGLAAIPFSPLPIGVKTLNYSAALLVCYLTFFIGVRFILLDRRIDWSVISFASHIALTFLSLAILFEFYLASFHGLFFSDVIPFVHKDLTIANLVNENFKRPRAFSAEPGFTALAFECLWPLTLLKPVDKRRAMWRHVLYAFGFFLLASAAAIVCLLISIFIVWSVKIRNVKDVLGIAGIVMLVSTPILITDVGRELLWSIIGRKIDIFTFNVSDDSDGVTALVRLTTYQIGLSLVESFPRGLGWGSIAQVFSQGGTLPIDGMLSGSGMLSLYLDIAVGAGLVGLFVFIWFIAVRIRCVLRSPKPHSINASVALISVCLHHSFITEFQFPFIWFLLALADRIAYERPLVVKNKDISIN